MDSKDILQSIETELAYLRKSAFAFLTNILIGQSLVITGKIVIPTTLSRVVWLKLALSFAFGIIDVLSYLVAWTYGQRIKSLRLARSTLIREAGLHDPYKDFKGPSTTSVYVLIIIIFSFLGLLLVWTAQ